MLRALPLEEPGADRDVRDRGREDEHAAPGLQRTRQQDEPGYEQECGVCDDESRARRTERVTSDADLLARRRDDVHQPEAGKRRQRRGGVGVAGDPRRRAAERSAGTRSAGSHDQVRKSAIAVVPTRMIARNASVSSVGSAPTRGGATRAATRPYAATTRASKRMATRRPRRPQGGRPRGRPPRAGARTGSWRRTARPRGRRSRRRRARCPAAGPDAAVATPRRRTRRSPPTSADHDAHRLGDPAAAEREAEEEDRGGDQRERRRPGESPTREPLLEVAQRRARRRSAGGRAGGRRSVRGPRPVAPCGTRRHAGGGEGCDRRADAGLPHGAGAGAAGAVAPARAAQVRGGGSRAVADAPLTLLWQLRPVRARAILASNSRTRASSAATRSGSAACRPPRFLVHEDARVRPSVTRALRPPGAP